MAKIHYARVDELWRKEQKYDFLINTQHCGQVAWQALQPDVRQIWLTEGMKQDFETFISVGNKTTKQEKSDNVQALFKLYSLGVVTARDAHVYSFDKNDLMRKARAFVNVYNFTVAKYRQSNAQLPIENLIDVTDQRIKWTRQVKASLGRQTLSELDEKHIRTALYRPFTKKLLYFDPFWNEEQYQFRQIFSTGLTTGENLTICVSDKGHRAPFSTMIVNQIPELHFCASTDATQCLPFYTYSEDGANRRENITDWALTQFRTHYQDPAITKWDIFHYVYALLHHPHYRTRYAANLRRELPRLPFAPDFHAFAQAGARLAELHVHYEQQSEYPLEKLETPGAALDWRVEKMRLSKDKRRLVYNGFLTLDGIPPAAFEYRLGNRSALEWVIDQYQVTTDKRSGITNDPNRADDPGYIVRLVGQVITVSLETQKIVQMLPPLRYASWTRTPSA